jgi:hypothetical protein
MHPHVLEEKKSLSKKERDKGQVDQSFVEECVHLLAEAK